MHITSYTVHCVLCTEQSDSFHQDEWCQQPLPCHLHHHIYTGTQGHACTSFFLGKVTALGVLCCFALFVCLTLLASFFLPSHLSFKNMNMQSSVFCVCVCVCTRAQMCSWIYISVHVCVTTSLPQLHVYHTCTHVQSCVYICKLKTAVHLNSNYCWSTCLLRTLNLHGRASCT